MISSGKTEWRGKAQKSFLIAGEDGYCEYWRRDKSPVEVLELAKLLHGIRKIVSHVGRNTGEVVWEGMHSKIEDIVLDPAPVLGTYPVPAAMADIAVGTAVREAYYKTEWTSYIMELAAKNNNLPPNYASKFSSYLEMAEKIYIDIVSNRNVLGIYTERAREWENEQATRQFLRPPSFMELLHIWWQMATDKKQEAFRHTYEDKIIVEMAGSIDTDQYYTKPLALLNSIIDRLITQCPLIKSVTERCEYRFDLYTSIFNKLLDHVKFWPNNRGDTYLLPSLFNEDMERANESKEATKATLLSFAEEIEKNVETKHTDYTNKVKSIVANFGEVARVEGNDLVVLSKNIVNKDILYKLKTVLQTVSQRTYAYNRGLSAGKIDRSRLFRAPTTGTIFNLKKVHFELYNDIVLLVDCTGSMADPTRWEKLEVICQTLFMAIHSYNSSARIFAYNERREACRITEIYKHGKFYSVTPHGRTASGEAIIATALNLKKGRRKPFIIHITDGASNWGCGVSEAIKYCKNRKISLLTLGLECDPMNNAALRDEYGELIQFVDDINQLPAMFRNLLSLSKFH
ncbi:MAG: hypothetical protein DRH08_00555 [Deltaproteobacteria bacterium]|nr:MAG: hypothetical protein DRH08_00555 [Deltaproteobacteria bacterium]